MTPYEQELLLKGQKHPIRPYYYNSLLTMSLASVDDPTHKTRHMILKPEIALKFATQLNKTCNFYVPPIKSFESTQPLQHRAIPAGVSHSSSGDGNNDNNNAGANANAKALTSLESMEGLPSSKGGGVNNSGNGSQSRHSSVNGSGHSSSRSRSAEGRLEAAVESLPSSSPLILSSLLVNPSGQGEGKGEGTNENNLAILLSTLSHKETVGGGGVGLGGGGGGRLSLQPPDPTPPSSDKNNLDTRSLLMSLPGSQGGRQEEMSGSNARARCCTITTYTTSNPN